VRDGEITSEAAPDGSHELATGKTLVVEGGKAVSLSGGMEEEGQAMEEEIEETIEDSNNMTEEEMEEKMQAMFENGMKELENKLTAMFTKQGEALAENRMQLDDEYSELKTQMRGIVTNFSIPANAGNHKDGNHEDKVLTQATPENLRAFRERLRANKA
jgi:N12 class adenine-specific DNA methylase